MSIVALKKVSICGLIDEKKEVLDGLQELGCLHLISLREPLAEPEKAAPERPESTYRALKFLTTCRNKRHQISEDTRFDLEAVVSKALYVKQRIRDVSDQRDFLVERVKEVGPWGNFYLPENNDLAGYRLWFYIVPVGLLRNLPKQDLVWEIVHRDHQFAHVVVVAKDEPPANAMPVKRTHTGILSLTELRTNLNETELELEDLRAERESLTRWIYLITLNLASTEDKAGRIHAEEQTLDNRELFAVQGWVPEQKMQQISEYARLRSLAVLLETPDPEEIPPTLMVNSQPLTAGEDLVKFYQTPGYWDWDPSVPVFFSFALFFAMILSDAGYAGLLALLLASYWQRLGRSSKRQRLRVLAATLVTFSFVWGVLVGSYFGVTPAETSLFGKLKILDINDFDTMMRLSVGIGVLHLSYANVHKAWRLRRKSLNWLVPIGWILVMFGGLLLWLGQTSEDVGNWMSIAGKWLVGSGFLAVFLFNSERKIKKPVDVIWRVLDGLQGVSGITKIFGDILSYLRLFALGLAGASLSMTFNNLAMQAREIEGPGLLYSLLILMLGHCLNILLSLMSAVVHGLRLNVIEFFNWGLTDEGYPFKAFAKKEISE